MRGNGGHCGGRAARRAQRPCRLEERDWIERGILLGDTQRSLRGAGGTRAVAESVDDEHPLLSVRRLHRPRVARDVLAGLGDAYAAR